MLKSTPITHLPQFDRLGAMAELEPGDQKAYVF